MNSNEFPRMVYRAGGTEEIHGGRFSTLIVYDEDALDAALADGWRLTTTEATEQGAADHAHALASHIAGPDAPPTRAELEQKATELGIEFSPRIGDAKLAERIEAALAGKA